VRVAFLRDDTGYAMAALLVAMSVMAVVLSTAMPVYQTVARREREAELIFRGEQYARAIALFQRKYGNALPPDVNVLIDQRFLRKKYKDPITGEDFQFMGPGSPELAQALSTTPQQALDAIRGRGAGMTTNTTTPQGGGRVQATPLGFGRATGAGGLQTATGGGMPPARGPLTAAGRAAGAQAGGGILAVASKSTQTSFRLYNGKSKYNEWIFMAVAATTAAGGGARGGQAPGGRGGRAGGRGGTPLGGSQSTPPSTNSTRPLTGVSPRK
jgi:type II secretory pathway pseudopilin PulG